MEYKVLTTAEVLIYTIHYPFHSLTELPLFGDLYTGVMHVYLLFNP